MSEGIQVTVGTTILELVEGDLTELPADAIVNPANSELVLGAGVAGAIRSKGGATVQAECDRLAPIQVGEAVITGGGRLAARRVIHAVGPRWGEGDEEEKLASAVRRVLQLSEEHGLRWVALPAISTGVFGFPVERAAAILLGTAIAFLLPGSHIERLTLCLWGEEAFRIFADELACHEVESR